jgi:hypothetical protein
VAGVAGGILPESRRRLRFPAGETDDGGMGPALPSDWLNEGDGWKAWNCCPAGRGGEVEGALGFSRLLDGGELQWLYQFSLAQTSVQVG